MNIGITWDAYGPGKMSVQEQISQIKNADFTNIFILAEEQGLDEIVNSSVKAGLTVDTLHAPWDGINAMWGNNEKGDWMLGRLTASVDNCKRNDIPILIVHLSAGDGAPHVNDIGGERFKKLTDYADSQGIIIAFENQRKLGNIAYAFERYTNAKFCWDIGHEDCFAYGRRYMPLFGDKVVALHIHDNYGEHDGDCHMLPFDAKVDFNRVAKTIAEFNYEGTVMLEVFKRNTPMYLDMTPEQYYERAANSARKLRSMIEKCK